MAASLALSFLTLQLMTYLTISQVYKSHSMLMTLHYGNQIEMFNFLKKDSKCSKQRRKLVQKWGFKLSASKTSVVLFPRKKDTNLNIYINKTKINLCKFAKFLGITFDQKLNWTQHINNVIDRCKKRLNILRCINKALIRSILEYGCEAFDSASNTIKQKLDSIQYQALKICTGAIHGTALSSLQIECGEPSLQLRRNFNNNTYGTKIELHKSHPNKNFKQDNWQKQYFAKKWQETSHHTPFETRYQKNNLNISPLLMNPFPYWHYMIPDISKRRRTSMKNVI